MHRANTDMLDRKLIAMGDLKGRAAMYDQTFEDIKGRFPGQDKISAAEITDYLQEVDNPDSLLFLKKRLGRMQQDGTNIPLNNGPQGFYDAIDGPTAIHLQTIHQKMVQDVIRGLDEAADAIIMIAGGPHIPGLAKQLEAAFKDNEKLVIGNFSERSNPDSEDFDKTAMFNSGTKRSCANIAGEVIDFKIDDQKQAILPAIIVDKMNILARDRDRTQPRTSPAETFVEKMIGKTKQGYHEL